MEQVYHPAKHKVCKFMVKTQGHRGPSSQLLSSPTLSQRPPAILGHPALRTLPAPCACAVSSEPHSVPRGTPMCLRVRPPLMGAEA